MLSASCCYDAILVLFRARTRPSTSASSASKSESFVGSVWFLPKRVPLDAKSAAYGFEDAVAVAGRGSLASDAYGFSPDSVGFVIFSAIFDAGAAWALALDDM